MFITIIGSGNVATHMAAAFKNAGHKIVQVYSRNKQNAALLAYHVGAEAIDDLNQILPGTDIFIIAVKDDLIEKAVQTLRQYGKLIVHTSGSTSLQTLLDYTSNAGVFYPLQTFSKTIEIDFLKVPLCIEGADEPITLLLKELAQTISNNVYLVDSDQRKTLHLAAVFACNFTNHLYAIAGQLLAESNLEFSMMRPLIQETANKIMRSLPTDVQTGPAVRRDEGTMHFQLEQLKDKPELQVIYTLLSQDIIKMDIDHNAGK